MKAARVADYGRYLSTKAARWTSSLVTFSLRDVPSLGSIDVPFSSAFTVLCGPNGVGKSTLLSALRAALDGNGGAEETNFGRKLSSGRAYLGLQNAKAALETEVTFNNGAVTRVSGNATQVVFINTGETVFSLQEEMCKFNSREDLLNGAGSKELNAAEVEEISYILRRDYRRITLSEVELGEVFPFFEVSYGDDDYDSRTMGAGELAALYIWWKVRSAEKNSFILIEEPETFLSSATQEAVGNFLVAMAFDCGHCITLTSHSAAIISPLPKGCLKFFYRAAGGLKLAEVPTPALLEMIGITTPVKAIAFVEDEAARTFAKLLLEQVDPVLSATISLEIREGHAKITSALDQLANVDGPIKFLGMFDGDMRADEAIGERSNALFLPGEEPIERIFKALVKSDPKQLASMRGVPEHKISEILYGAEGADHHDWYHAVCKGLGLTKEQLFSTLFVLWQRDEKNTEAMNEWHASVTALITDT